mgnify:CR=1 FL=1
MAYAGYVERLITHQSNLMEDVERKLGEQRWQTSAIAILVLLMVFSGIVLAALQFYVDYKNKGRSAIHFKIGSGSLESKSSVIGLAVLVFSMWFFYLYIDRVYSIRTITIPPLAWGQTAANVGSAGAGNPEVLSLNHHTESRK